jgi:hypothetical protein
MISPLGPKSRFEFGSRAVDSEMPTRMSAPKILLQTNEKIFSEKFSYAVQQRKVLRHSAFENAVWFD